MSPILGTGDGTALYSSTTDLICRAYHPYTVDVSTKNYPSGFKEVLSGLAGLGSVNQ